MTPTRKARRRGAGIGQDNSSRVAVHRPVVLLLGLFLFIPVLMAAWVSVSDWTGRGSPFASDVAYVGADNYARILFGGGLDTRTSERPAQQPLLRPHRGTGADGAGVVPRGSHQPADARGRGFFRTPSTSRR